MPRPTFFITDVFTDKKYGGNPLATFIDCEKLSSHDMQNIAKEINFSETTFILSREATENGYPVRIFTPRAEIDFAGHPTLGTAYVIRHLLKLTATNEIRLHLNIGTIPVHFSEQNSFLWMQQMPPLFGEQAQICDIAPILGLSPADFNPHFPIQEVSTGLPTLIIPLAHQAALKQIHINKTLYFSWAASSWAKLILAFCPSGYEANQALSARVFGDFYGIPEDPATGSSNGALAAYLSQHAFFEKKEIDLLVGQGYEINRPSTLALKTECTPNILKVFVGGNVVTIAQGIWG